MKDSELEALTQDAVELALKAGADHADCVGGINHELSYEQRLGKVEGMEESEGHKLGLRVMVGGAQAIVSSNDGKRDTLRDLATRAVQMAKLVPVDKDCLPADKEQLFKNPPKDNGLELYDDTPVTMEMLIEATARAEQTALDHKGISNSEGSGASASKMTVSLAISNGFTASTKKTHFSLSAAMIAGEGDGMQTDHEYKVTNHWADLPDAEFIGRRAAERTLAKLGAKQGRSLEAPVIFDPRVGRGLLGSLLSAINGDAICKGTSFLKEKNGQKIFSDAINIIEDPHLPRSMGARIFDAEGIATKKRHWVQDGILQGWLLDLRTARKLNLSSTGNAARGISSAPSPSVSNVYIEAGKASQADLLADIKEGFYVTQLMGMGVNLITGDFSQGAEGFWIENGKLTYAVQEMTIAGHLLEMFQHMTAANDLEFDRAINVPSLKIQQMIIAGNND